ncbi:DUF2964 family protein [Burkholderia guangdongensis]|uniref:DUF2964 family protein n=1 Tax=Burkholderia guangdongensis TaxID=1792500 RepID=UPI0015CDD2AA|nr:DUF2964 family protein [Burkholderia guangdongensis]
MVRAELRVVVAAIATFVVLAGIAMAIHGLLFDRAGALYGGVLAITLGVTTCVVELTVWPKDRS